MNIEVCVEYPDDTLEKHRPEGDDVQWQLVASGRWSQDMYHGGNVGYYIAKDFDGRWIMNPVLPGGGRRQKNIERIAADCTGTRRNANVKRIAQMMYDAIRAAGGMAIDDPDDYDDEKPLLRV